MSEEKKNTVETENVNTDTAAEEKSKAAEATENAENSVQNEETADNSGSEKAGFFDKKKAKKLEAKIAELEKKLAEAEAASKEKDAKYLLLYAEYDNFRRRSQKEKDGIWTDAYSDAINKLLPVLDNLYRAVDSRDAAGLAEGLAMTVKSYEDSLAKMGVEEIKALGETFDPDKHSAVLHVEDENYGEGEIVEVLAKGYIRDGKVIRYAVVKVAN